MPEARIDLLSAYSSNITWITITVVLSSDQVSNLLDHIDSSHVEHLLEGRRTVVGKASDVGDNSNLLQIVFSSSMIIFSSSIISKSVRKKRTRIHSSHE